MIATTKWNPGEQATEEARKDERDLRLGRAWREALPGANPAQTAAFVNEVLQHIADEYDEDKHVRLVTNAHLAGLITRKELEDFADCDGRMDCCCPGDDARCIHCGGRPGPCGHDLCEYIHDLDDPGEP